MNQSISLLLFSTLLWTGPSLLAKSYSKKQLRYKIDQQQNYPATRYYNDNGTLKAEIIGKKDSIYKKILHLQKKDKYLIIVKTPATGRRDVYGAIYKNRKWNVIIKSSKSSIAFHRLVFDRYGNLLLKENLNSQKKRAIDSQGIARYKYKYNRYGEIIQESYYNTEKKLTTGKKHYAMVKYRYHRGCKKYNTKKNDCYRSIRYYGTDQKLSQNKDGISQIITYFNRKGKMTKKKFLDPHGKLAQDKLGISFYRYFYNRYGRLRYEKSYGKDGSLKEDPDNIAIIEYQYAQRNKQITVTYKGIDGIHREDFDGFGKHVYLYDSHGNRIRETYYDLEQNILQQAFHQYDNQGQKTYSLRIDGQKKILSQTGIAKNRTVHAYTRRKKKKSTSVFSVRGKLLQKTLYNNMELPLEQQYYSTDGQLEETIKYTYDKRGRIRRKRSYDAGQQLQYYHIIDYDKGVIHDKRYSKNKRLTASRDGVAIRRYTYGKTGKLRVEEFFTANGKHAQDNFGVFRTIYTYNNACLRFRQEKEHCIQTVEYYNQYEKRVRLKTSQINLSRAYSINQNDILKKNGAGISAYRFKYDKKGRMISRETLDKNDTLINSKYMNGIAKTIFGYDKKGNPSLYETFAANGKRQENGRGIAKYRFLYQNKQKIYQENYNKQDIIIAKLHFQNNRPQRYEYFDSIGQLTRAKYCIILPTRYRKKLKLDCDKFHIPTQVEFIKSP